MQEHPYGWLSLVPSLIAIGLAIATRRVVVSMLVGIFAGALITCHGHPIHAVGDMLELHLWTSLVDPDRLRVFAFTMLMGAMVGIIERCGGMNGLVAMVARWANNRRRGQLATWALGLLIFFDDYANTLLLGNTLQPLCRKLRISKEKLSFLVDATAAPVAGMAVISTWVAGEIDFVQSGLSAVHADAHTFSAFSMFMQSLAYRFYPIWTIVFVFLIGWSDRDFGPMLDAERREWTNGNANGGPHDLTLDAIRPSAWWNAVVPILITLAGVTGLLYYSGLAKWSDTAADPTLMQICGAADSNFALLWGAFAGLVGAIVVTVGQRLLTWEETQTAMAGGAKQMLPAIVILWLASSLSALTGREPLDVKPPTAAAATTTFPAQEYRLYTGEYLTSLISGQQGHTPALAPWLPTLIFVLSCGISFATGTSWGTMAIVMPIAIQLAFGVLGSEGELSPQDPLLIATIGSVLAGSIFGDHCSPISDTTILSSQSCACDHTAHVWTQLPYAVAVGVISVLCGTLPVGFGCPVGVALALGCICVTITVYVAGQKVTDGFHSRE